MRHDALEKMSDIVYNEAMNDGIVEMILATQVQIVERPSRPVPGEPVEWRTIKSSNPLTYLLLDELEIGVNMPVGERQEVLLRVVLPEGWGREQE